MPINSQIDSAKKLTLYSVEGEVSYDEIVASLKSFYSGNPTLNVIWDFSKSAGRGLSREQIEKIAVFVCEHIPATRIGGKSAAVTPRDLEYGLGRMAEAFFEMNKYKSEYRNFRRFEDAVAWVKGESD